MNRALRIVAVALLLVAAACGGDDDSSSDDGATDQPTTTDADGARSDDDGDSGEGGDALPSTLTSSAAVIEALGLTRCEAGGGNVLTMASPPAESFNCGDTGELHWFADQAAYEAGLAEARSQLCPVDDDWGYLSGEWWAVYAELPAEPGSDDTALEIMGRRANGGAALRTLDC